LPNVLILAREEVVAALLGLMVELRGMKPRFLTEGQSVATSLGRGGFPVLIDCDHPDCSDETIDLIRKRGGEPILFSPFRLQAEVARLASRYGTRSFTLPTDPETLGKLLMF
jgi:hypothetical protein